MYNIGKSGMLEVWSPDQRRAIVTYVDGRACKAIDADGTDAFEAVRDRALVTMLAYSGVRDMGYIESVRSQATARR